MVLTDGTNDDPAGISLENLLAVLGGEFDPARPVQVDIIRLGGVTGNGGGMDRGTFTRIAEATRGGMYAAGSPQQARELFRAAMLRRP